MRQKLTSPIASTERESITVRHQACYGRCKLYNIVNMYFMYILPQVRKILSSRKYVIYFPWFIWFGNLIWLLLVYSSDCTTCTFDLSYMLKSEISLHVHIYIHICCSNISITIHTNHLEMMHRYDHVLMYHIMPADCNFIELKFLVCYKWPISKIRGISLDWIQLSFKNYSRDPLNSELAILKTNMYICLWTF